MKYKVIFAIALFISTFSASAQKEFSIWADKELRKQSAEQIDTTVWPNDPLLFNVSEASLTFYPADPAVSKGASVIICPGGAFFYLHVKTEGSDVAKWLNKKGVSAFVLKYRLIHCETSHPVSERYEKMKDSSNTRKLFAPLIPLAIADGKQAISFVRVHAKDFGIAPDKLGVMGFSAGGVLCVASAFDSSLEGRPNFIAPIYAFVPPTLQVTVVKSTAPMFIAAASDDEAHLVPTSINLYNKWLAAGVPAELHIYSKGGHGFGMNKNNLPSDKWIDRFGDWLKLQGLSN